MFTTRSNKEVAFVKPTIQTIIKRHDSMVFSLQCNFSSKKKKKKTLSNILRLCIVNNSSNHARLINSIRFLSSVEILRRLYFAFPRAKITCSVLADSRLDENALSRCKVRGNGRHRGCFIASSSPPPSSQ